MPDWGPQTTFRRPGDCRSGPCAGVCNKQTSRNMAYPKQADHMRWLATQTEPIQQYTCDGKLGGHQQNSLAYWTVLAPQVLLHSTSPTPCQALASKHWSLAVPLRLLLQPLLRLASMCTAICSCRVRSQSWRLILTTLLQRGHNCTRCLMDVR